MNDNLVLDAVISGMLAVIVTFAIAFGLVVLTVKYVIEFVMSLTGKYEDGGYYPGYDDDPDPEPDTDPDPIGRRPRFTGHLDELADPNPLPGEVDFYDFGPPEVETEARRLVAAALARLAHPTLAPGLAAYLQPFPGHPAACDCVPCFNTFVNNWIAAEASRIIAHAGNPS